MAGEPSVTVSNGNESNGYNIPPADLISISETVNYDPSIVTNAVVYQEVWNTEKEFAPRMILQRPVTQAVAPSTKPVLLNEGYHRGIWYPDLTQGFNNSFLLYIYIYDILHDLVPFLQFKKRGKHQ